MKTRWEKTMALFAVALSLSGCVTARPKEISPAKMAAAFEGRTLDNPGFKQLLEANLGRAVAPWPPKSWDFSMLSIAAFYHHPDLAVVRARWNVAEAGVMTAGGRPNPSASFTRERNADAPEGKSPRILGYALGIPIETAGKRGYRIDQAEHLSEAARLQIANTAWQIRSRLRAALLDVYASDLAETILVRQESNQAEIVKLLEQRMASGVVSTFEVIQSRQALDRTRLSLQETFRQKSEARVKLAVAIGLPVTALDSANIYYDFLEKLPKIKNLPIGKIRQQALQSRPDILAGLAEYAAACSALQLEIAKRYPDIQLGPGYAWDQGDRKWALGLSATLPIFNQNRGPIAEAEARVKEAEAGFVARQAQITGEIDRAIAGYTAALQKLGMAESILSGRKKQQESIRAIYRTGRNADQVEILKNQASFQIEIDAGTLARVDALVQAQQALGQLEDGAQVPLSPADADTFSFFPNPKP